MLFNTLVFTLIFLPITLLLLTLLARWRQSAAVVWMGVVSLAFYAWTEWRYLPLLLGSIMANYLIGMAILSTLHRGSQAKRTTGRSLLALGLVFNLGLLGWYKYSGLLARSVEAFAGTQLGFAAPILPIGISFFTFTQIAFLVDASRGKVSDRGFFRYLVFVTYFPHLIAGPILHHAAMMPQFANRAFGKIRASDLQAGLAIFLIGLLKKVVLADQAAQYVGPVFDASADPRLGSADAWAGVLAYTCQIYFDFSGYSDMAIGLGRMMSITLPENFNSPYKATSITDFWRRWHISLSNFLRDYLYIALGGNRHGPTRRYVNLMTTMLLGGLWHGASWTFLAWGGLHGAYLVANHAWRGLTDRLGWSKMRDRHLYRGLSWGLTLLCVINAWVFFRAADFESGFRLLRLMYGIEGAAEAGRAVSFDVATAYRTCAVCALTALAMPNTFKLRRMWHERAAARSLTTRTAGATWFTLGALMTAVLIVTLMAESAASRSAFIYFNF